MNPRPPPRLLLGTALLFWGAATGRPVVGLILAMVVEAAHWTRLRWDFDDAAHIRAWQISAVTAGLALVMLWIDDAPLMAAPRLLGWFPALLLPLQFVQSYGLRHDMSIRVFSFFTRQQRASKHGYVPDPARGRFNFGHVYLVATLVAATPIWKMPDFPLQVPCLAALAAWALIGSRRCRWQHVATLAVLALGIGWAGQYGLDRAYQWVNSGWYRNRGLSQHPSHFRTMIGKLGEIKQSGDIVWRLRTGAGSPVPTHLRSFAYNRYRGGFWSNLQTQDDRVPTAPRLSNEYRLTLTDDFAPVEYVENANASRYYKLRRPPAEAPLPEGPVFSIRGRVENESPVPLPGNAAELHGFDVYSFEANPVGTVVIFPKAPVVEGEVRWNAGGSRESPPWEETDLWIDDNERPALAKVLTDLRLAEVSDLRSKLAIVKRFFDGFEYSLYNTIQAPRVGDPKDNTAITKFLTATRRGHCEYFATAACLLLREAGIPTRYAVGYTVAERDARRGEWVIRGKHAHAWTRVWDAQTGTWLDFDPTPSGWMDLESGTGGFFQPISDFFRRTSEDFNLWRAKPGNTAIVAASLLGVGGLGLVFIMRRLWRSKRIVNGRRRIKENDPRAVLTPLRRLESLAEKRLGPRGDGEPFARWLQGLTPLLGDPDRLDEALEIHQRLRFDPEPPPQADTGRLAELTKLLERHIKNTPRR